MVAPEVEIVDSARQVSQHAHLGLVPSSDIDPAGEVRDFNDAVWIGRQLLVEPLLIGVDGCAGCEQNREAQDSHARFTPPGTKFNHQAHLQIPWPASLASCTVVRTRISS